MLLLLRTQAIHSSESRTRIIWPQVLTVFEAGPTRTLPPLDARLAPPHIAVSGSDPGRPQAQAMVKSETSTDLGILPVGGNADPVFYGTM